MFAVIYLPDFFLQAALRHEPELFARPVAVLHEDLKFICQATAAAQHHAVHAGLTPTQALARCPNLIVRSRSATQEGSTTELLLECAYAFSPAIEDTAPGICSLDLQGLPAVLTSKEDESAGAPWARRIINQLAACHLRAQVGIAANPDLALQAARKASPFLLVEKPEEFLAALPVKDIDPSPEILSLLQRWGIRTLGDLTALQKNNLAERLGPEALELFDRAMAAQVRPLNLVRPREIFQEAVEFETEIETLQPLLFILRRFIEQLSRRLELFYLAAEEIHLRLQLSSGEKLERVYRIPSPTRNIDTLFRLLQTHLESVQTDAPITALELAVRPAQPEHFQFGLFETALRDPNHFYETLAQLNSLLGSERVGSPVLENSFQPDAFRMGAVNFDAFPASGRSAPGSATTTAPPSLISPSLCLRRYRPPVPVQVETQEQRPVLLRGEKIAGTVSRANGPFRASGHWWEDGRLWTRDEWDVQTTRGDVLRLFNEGGRWFVEGMYD